MLCFLLLTNCGHPEPASLTNDAYIWQRHWDDALLASIREAAPQVRAWRVLLEEVDERGGAVKVAVNWDALRQSGKPVIGVVRMKSLRLDVIRKDWRKDWPVSGLEIDYDCAVSQLPAYREFLRGLRGQWKQKPLSITALPSWMESAELPQVLAQVDETLLQVHSVMNAKKGLFDRTTAYQWARQWAGVSATPFQLALPTYWSRVSWNAVGKVEAIESEADRYGESGISQELFIEPGEVSALVRQLRQRPVEKLRGLAWFRLPTNNDRRAWSLITWRAVMAGQPLPPVTPILQWKENETGARDLFLHNAGDRAARLPAEILLVSQECSAGDALPPYHLQRTKEQVQIRLNNGARGVLREGEDRMIGWVRCAGRSVETHVSSNQ